MTELEVILAFASVMGVLSLPLMLIVNRKGSPIGEALAERVRRKTERRYGPSTAVFPKPAPKTMALEHSADESDAFAQQEVARLAERVDFLERLLEERSRAART